jgi:hypothetical protein
MSLPGRLLMTATASANFFYKVQAKASGGIGDSPDNEIAILPIYQELTIT